MRFTRLRAPAFGVLEDLDTGETPLGGLVVVEGRNEAGKSTFFELLCVLLHGYYPASRDAYPYSPWGGRAAEAEGRLRLDSGDEWTVRRRLPSTPRGSLVDGDREEELRNRTIPWVEHVPRPVFRQVFALTLSELAALEGEGWSAVQDRLLGAMGASDLRPARTVVEELQGEAGSLWRPSRRGRQALRELEDRIRELRLDRHRVLDEEARIREVARDRDRAAGELEGLRTEREGARVALERIRTLLPVRTRLRRILELEARAGPPAELAGLPEDVEAHRARLRERAAELQRRLGRIEEDRIEAREAAGHLLPSDEELLARQAEVERCTSGWAGADAIRARRAVLVREIRDREGQIAEATRSLLDREPDPSLRNAVRSLPVPALRSAVDRMLRARRAVEALAAAGPEPAAGAPARSWTGAAVAVLGAVLLVAGLARGETALAVAGGLCAGAGLGLLVAGGSRWIRAGVSRSEGQGRRDDRAGAERELAEAARELAELLEPLAPGPGAPEPGPELPVRIERLQEWLREADDRREERAALEARIEATAKSLRALGALLPEPDPPEDPGALAHLLDRALQRAGARRASARAATRELARLDRARQELETEGERLRAAAVALDQALSRIGGGDVEAGAREVAAREDARARARQLREELERDHPDLESIRGRIRRAEEEQEEWTVDPEARARLQARLQEVDDRIEGLTGRLEALDKELEFLGRRTRLDEIDGRILALREEARGLARRRDRLWVLSRIVQEAERSVREEHQPAVLREASTILGELTGGRYDRILLAGREGRSFRIRGPGMRQSLPAAAPLSTGTREQVYLALRLAVLDQLDRGGERLPLFLDEVLVNWDPERREAGLRVLAERSRTRQSFFFTCHPEMARRLVGLGATRVVLPDPSA